MAYFTLFLPGRPEPEGRIEPITADEFTIGRERDNHLIVLDSRVSRHHVRVVREAEGYFLVDNDSANGTWIDNRKVTRQRLREGDKIQLGDSQLIFSEAPAPVPAVSPNRQLPLTPDLAGVSGRVTAPHPVPPPDPVETLPQPPPPPVAVPRKIFCVNCGQALDAGDRFCTACGFAAFPE
jgi:pSer/pThr/pTyr-binding forkhead associated (FHA) protein